ncbi:unnamed protein product [Symbiodinium microadriaticum]|nr:unnamed protein product [Symbiodinium microadriaticum]CAE7948092.1 unnamed protein product [Symbiodinium sp. KB8]
MCYFHLPQKSHGQSRNHGYAFIGFLTPEVAGRFRDAMTGYSFKTRPSLKRVIVRPARIQSQVEVWQPGGTWFSGLRVQGAALSALSSDCLCAF